VNLPTAQTSADDTLQNQQQQQFTLYRVTLALHIRSSVTWPYNLVSHVVLYECKYTYCIKIRISVYNTMLRVNVSDLSSDKLMADYLQHVSVQKYHLQVIQITKIATQKYWVKGGLYINEISFVQLISAHHNDPSIKTQNQVPLLSNFLYMCYPMMVHLDRNQ